MVSNRTDNAEDALASEAYIAGRRAGRMLLSPSLNPHPPGTTAHLQWEQGRQSAASQHLNEASRRNAA